MDWNRGRLSWIIYPFQASSPNLFFLFLFFSLIWLCRLLRNGGWALDAGGLCLFLPVSPLLIEFSLFPLSKANVNPHSFCLISGTFSFFFCCMNQTMEKEVKQFQVQWQLWCNSIDVPSDNTMSRTEFCWCLLKWSWLVWFCRSTCIKELCGSAVWPWIQAWRRSYDFELELSLLLLLLLGAESPLTRDGGVHCRGSSLSKPQPVTQLIQWKGLLASAPRSCRGCLEGRK